MRIVECDRCGKQMDAKLTELWSELKHNGVALDLCPHCTELFDAFMSGINYVNDMTLVQKEKEPKKEPPKEPKKAEAPKPKRIDVGKIHALADAGWKIKDIAEEMGCSEQTVRNHLAKGGPND